eukprot:TRINITY_DN10877_c0_g1_i1.p1 TRINITY_DN10877_c0_g1~~TRINITY_DN10877_c0_g1_i1.p1  ORF type:complete len:311 (+),score=69.24 TRINITY_DN10877_c0_g1_i1:104-934(+)
MLNLLDLINTDLKVRIASNKISCCDFCSKSIESKKSDPQVEVEVEAFPNEITTNLLSQKNLILCLLAQICMKNSNHVFASSLLSRALMCNCNCEPTGEVISYNSNQEKVTLYITMIQLLVDSGSVVKAEMCFESMKNIIKDDDSVSLPLCEAMLLFCKDEYAKASEKYKSVIKSLTDKSDKSLVEEHLLSIASNNLSVCALHCCQLRDAIYFSEDLVRQNPRHNISPALVLNLCSLYEVRWCDATTVQKRKDLLMEIARRAGVLECIPKRCFKPAK